MGSQLKLLPGYVILLALGAVLGIAGTVMVYRTQPAPIRIQPPGPTPSRAATATASPIHVYVNGAVVAAAVYELPPTCLVEQAIEAAGGFTAEANTAVVNLAQPLRDGVQVYVPAIGEVVAGPRWGVNDPSPDAPAGQTVVTGQRVNINTASSAQLQQLPGIGPSIAQNILDYRNANGPFTTVEEIMEVSGIGEAKFGQMKDMIVIQGE